MFAFQNAEAGDIMVQKSPASTAWVIWSSSQELFNVNNEIKL